MNADGLEEQETGQSEGIKSLARLLENMGELDCKQPLSNPASQLLRELEQNAQAKAQAGARQQSVPDAQLEDAFAQIGLEEGEEVRALEGRMRDFTSCEESSGAVVLEQEHTYSARAQQRMSVNVHRARLREARPRLIGPKDNRYGFDSDLSFEMFRSKSPAKPVWAVVGSVWLRAHGKCEVCGETITSVNDAKVVRMVPPKWGGQFTEPNVVLVCVHCMEAWGSKKFFVTGAVSLHLMELKVYILGRRMRSVGNQGTQTKKFKQLNEAGMMRWYKLKAELEKLDMNRDEIIERATRPVVMFPEIDPASPLLA